LIWSTDSFDRESYVHGIMQGEAAEMDDVTWIYRKLESIEAFSVFNGVVSFGNVDDEIGESVK
jgi:hypothetical protein